MAKRSLGSGLHELLGDIDAVYEKNYNETHGVIREIQLNSILANPMQPRQNFDEKSLRELANSIEHYGLLQPIVVREDEHGTYILIAGERRLRATKMLQRESIQALVITAEEHKMRELALIENVQREDLNPIDLALCYQALLQEYNLTQEQLAQKIYKSRTQITNTLRLLELSQSAQELIKDGKLTQGHAKMLIGLSPSDEAIALQTIFGQKLNVRETETLTKTMKTKNKDTPTESTYIDSLQKLQTILKNYHIASTIKHNRIILECDAQSQLDIILQKLQ